jgi:hypothetical protein
LIENVTLETQQSKAVRRKSGNEAKRTYPTSGGVTEKTDRIHLKDAARMLEVSVMTIRRDFSQDDEPLPLALLGGYIVMVNKPSAPIAAPQPLPYGRIIVMIYLSPSLLPDW